jgi:hypothetical protein
METTTSRGKVTVGYGTAQQREIEIVDFVQARFTDNRVISICQVDDNASMVATVENPASTGRAPAQSIWLSQESFVGLMVTAMMYLAAKGEPLSDILKAAAKNDEIDYTFSDNLNALDDDATEAEKCTYCKSTVDVKKWDGATYQCHDCFDSARKFEDDYS